MQVFLIVVGVLLTCFMGFVAFMLREFYRRVLKFEERFERLLHLIIRCEYCPKVGFD